MSCVDDLPAGREERHHLAVPRGMHQLVERTSDQEQGPILAGRLPARPGSIGVAETSLQVERLHQRLEDRQRPLEVSHADEDMREHEVLSWVAIQIPVATIARPRTVFQRIVSPSSTAPTSDAVTGLTVTAMATFVGVVRPSAK